MMAEERILALINPAYRECIPSFVREHAEACSCKRIKREFPELYRLFTQEDDPDEKTLARMSEIINTIIEERIIKKQRR